MKSKLLVLTLLAASAAFAETRFYVGIGVGGYPVAPPPVVAYQPPCPGPGYSWVAGYYYPAEPRWAWRAGYWARPPYAGGYWVAPRYYGNRYYNGYWSAPRYRGHGYDRDRYDHDRYDHDRYDHDRFDRDRYDRGHWRR